MQLPRVALIGTGGTIAMTPGSSGIVPSLSAQDLIQAVPALPRHARLETLSHSLKPGAALLLEDLVAIAERIDALAADGVTGAIVVQGTDTIEETAFVLDVLVRSEIPVVVTGAMRGAGAPGSDGPANLLAAVVVASTPQAAGMGALVVMNDEVHAARYVRKCHTALPSAFASPGAGPVGCVIEEALTLHWRPTRSPPLSRPRTAELPGAAVALVAMSLGDDGRMLDALPALGYRGVVLEALGAGHVPPLMVPKIQALAESMPVVLSTRVIAGSIFTRTYGFSGSETDLLKRGVIPSGSLGAAKSLQLLRLLLAGGVPRTDLPGYIERYAKR